jgi:hypothetical protein
MTLDTRIFILDPINHKQVYAQCGRLIGQHEGIKFTDDPVFDYRNGEKIPSPDGLRSIWNKPGQGLPALLDMTYREGGPIKADPNACDRYCDDDEPCDQESHKPAHWIEVSFDTAYGYRDDEGRGCGDLHASLVSQLGQWLDERHVRWMWQNEFTGEIHSGYERLVELCSAGFEATAWFETTVKPAILGRAAS